MLLAIDTATRMTGIALHDGNRVHAEYIWRGGHYQTVELAPEVTLMMRRAGIRTGRLKAVAVAKGPGSYTGLRIGMALAKGISLAKGLPLVGIPTLEILASGQPRMDAPMLALIKAGRDRFVCQWFAWREGGWGSRDAMRNLDWQELIAQLEGAVYLVGELDSEQRREVSGLRNVNLAPPSRCLRRPAVIAELGWDRLGSREHLAPAELAPTYQASAGATGG